MQNSNDKFHFIIMIILALILTTGCSSNDFIIEEGKVSVVTSFYPLYDFTKRIGGDHVQVINLIPIGVEPHEWTPKSKDMTHITKADLFVYNGAGFEAWVPSFLKGLKNDSKLVILAASDDIELINNSEQAGHEEELDHVGIDEHEEQHDHDNAEVNHEEEDDGHHHFHGEVDPHVWLSPLQAMKLAENIKDGLIQVDEAHRADYETNYEQLLGQLHELHLKYEQMTSEATRTDFIVSHQSFGYLARDYGLKQVAIMGLSPEAEPTAQDIMAISKFIKENQVKYILFEELASPQLAKTLANDLKIETLVLNPLEGLTNEQEKGGDDYISVMERNLTTLKKALQ